MRFLLLWCFFTCLMAVEPEKNNEPAPPRITVVVAEFQNRHPLLEQDWLASACADLVASALSSASRDVASGITVLDRSGIAALEQESRIAGEVAIAQGAVANHVLGGSFTVSDERLVVEVALSTAGQQRWSQRLEGTVDQVPTLARRIAAGALAALSARVTMPAVGDARAARDLPLAALVTLQRGRVAAARGDHAWAIADLLRTCKLAPHYGEAWLALGSSFEALGRPAAALAAWEQAVTVDPDDPGMAVALFRLARAQEERRPEYAQRLYERLLQDYPYSPAPLDLTGPQFNGPPITLAELAGKRLVQLVLVVPPSGDQRSQARPAGDGAAAGAVRGISAGAPVVGQLVRRINRITEVRARNEYANPENELLLRLAVWSAAGGWPEGWPVVRLVDGQPVIARVGQANFDVAPPPGMAIDRLTVAPAPRPGAPAGPYRYNLSTHTISDIGGSGRALVSSKDGEPVTVTIPPNFALGFSAGGFVTTVERRSPTGASIADLQLTAALRPVRPGAIWMTTQPPGALITIDGIPRGVTPCRIGDLTPGTIRVKADSLVSRPSASNDRPIQSYLHFGDEADIAVADTGETRVEWMLTHRPQPAADGWSALLPMLPAPPATEVLGVTISWNERPPLCRPQVITHAKAGTVLFWQQDGEVRAATTHDARTWKALSSLPFNSGADESLAAVAVSPQGLVLVAFRRGEELWSVTSSDLAGWTPPVRIAEVRDEDDRETGQRRVAGAVWSSAGKFVVVYRSRMGDQYYTAMSGDGRTWSAMLTPLVHSDAWWPNSSIALQRFADGAPALLAIARLDKEKQKQAVIVRFALGSNGWEVRDQSPPFERSRTHEPDASLLANGADGSIHLVSRSGSGVRWVPGGDLQTTSGLAVLGTECAIIAAPGGAMLVVPWAGSWWMATAGSAPATTVVPQVTYEISPTTPGVTAITTPTAPVLAATEVAAPPAAGSPVTATSVPITAPGETRSASEPVRRGRSPLTIVLVFGVVVLLTAGITWWWWGFLKRRREEGQP